MKVIKLKSALRFWQEMIFIIALGVLVIGITMNISVSFKYGINIVFYCIFVSLLISLIGQLFWKNLVLAMCLAPILAFGSVWTFLAVLSDLGEIPVWDTKTIAILILYMLMSIGLIIAAITMPKKYLIK